MREGNCVINALPQEIGRSVNLNLNLQQASSWPSRSDRGPGRRRAGAPTRSTVARFVAESQPAAVLCQECPSLPSPELELSCAVRRSDDRLGRSEGGTGLQVGPCGGAGGRGYRGGSRNLKLGWAARAGQHSARVSPGCGSNSLAPRSGARAPGPA
jgi:hypothetical protein